MDKNLSRLSYVTDLHLRFPKDLRKALATSAFWIRNQGLGRPCELITEAESNTKVGRKGGQEETCSLLRCGVMLIGQPTEHLITKRWLPNWAKPSTESANS